MPSNVPDMLRLLAWLAVLGGAVLVASKLVGRVQSKVA